MTEFEWDPQKARSNSAKLGVAFEEARTVFGDPLELAIAGPNHSEGELRFLSIGRSELGRLLVISYTEREPNKIRLISARSASQAEKKQYDSRYRIVGAEA